jgi:hypothetical protein
MLAPRGAPAADANMKAVRVRYMPMFLRDYSEPWRCMLCVLQVQLLNSVEDAMLSHLKLTVTSQHCASVIHTGLVLQNQWYFNYD